MNTPPPALTLPDKVYFRIGEVAALLGVKTHVVRFWQQQFPTVRPERSRTGRFLYTKATVTRLHLIKHLLYAEGYTIPGARKALRAGARKGSKAVADARATASPETEKAKAISAKPVGASGGPEPADEAASPTDGAQSQRIRDLEAELLEAQHRLSEVDGLRTQVDALRARADEVEALRLQVAELDGLRTQVGEIAALREALADAREENERNAVTLAEQSTVVTGAADQRAEDLAVELGGAQAALNRVQTDCAQLRVALAARTKEVVALRGEHDKTLAANQAQHEAVVHELKTAGEHDVAHLETELAERIDEIAGLKNDHHDALSALKAAHARALEAALSSGATDEKARGALNAEVAALGEAVERHVAALNAKDDELTATNEALTTARANLADATAAITASHADVSALRESEAHLQRAATEHASTRATLVSEIEDLSAQIEAQSKEEQRLADKVDSLTQTLAEAPSDPRALAAMTAARDDALRAVVKAESTEERLLARSADLERALRDSLVDLRLWVTDAGA